MTPKRVEDEGLSPHGNSNGVSVLVLASNPDFVAAFEILRTERKFIISIQEESAKDTLESAQMIFVECHVVGGLKDLKKIREIRRVRPLTPIVGIGVNSDPEYIVMAMHEGATDYIKDIPSPDYLEAKIQNLFKLSRVAQLMEVQNNELVSSMAALRESNEQLRKEIIERVKAEEEREKTREQLVQASKMASLGEMAGGIAHEIRTPLSVITGLVSLLQDGLDETPYNFTEARTLLKDVEHMADRIEAIIRGLKSFSREGERDPYEHVPISTIFKDTLAFCREAIEHSGIELKLNIPSHIELDCQPTQISQVILNLVGNAKHAVEKLEKKWISIDVEDQDELVQISITDSGPGIPAEIRNKVLEPFFTTKPKGIGTGLGLSISAKIATAHGGRLWINEKCPNTQFVFTIKKEAPPEKKPIPKAA